MFLIWNWPLTIILYWIALLHCAPKQALLNKKSCIRETKNLSTDADSKTDTILERLRDLKQSKKTNKCERLRGGDI